MKCNKRCSGACMGKYNMSERDTQSKGRLILPNIAEYMSCVKKIQRWYRGSILRLKRLPTVLYSMQSYLKTRNFIFAEGNDDGRVNSTIDEPGIIDLLVSKYGDKRIKKPKIRMWFDILVRDYMYGWLPVNIKTTTTSTSDNTGNMAMCVYAYTDEVLELDTSKSYNNGKMSKILLSRLKERRYNKISKKDYYFVVLNKSDSKDIIVNSVKGLTVLTPNINNLPYQVNWGQNREFVHESIEKSVKKFVECLKSPKPSWREEFMANIRMME